jgi:putative selenium metabolism hydrolase
VTLDESGIVAFTQALVRHKTVSGQEEPAARCAIERMRALGFDEVWADDYGSVVGRVRGTRGGTRRRMLFDAHLDTVDVSSPERWTHACFGGECIGGRIYGRGASDLKGSLAAMVYAVASLIPVKDQLAGDVLVSATVAEELFEGAALAKVLERVHPDWVVIGEATNLNLHRGQRGRGEVTLTTIGRPAHSANPQAGVNAVRKMMRLVQAIEQLPLPTSDFLGPAILELTDILSTPYPGASVVPERCQATFDRRLLVGETECDVLAPLRECIERLRTSDRDLVADVQIATGELTTYTGQTLKANKFAPAWEIPEASPLVQGALRALRSMGVQPAIGCYGFCTNGSYSAGVAGVPTIGFGPSREDQAHVTDEYVEVAQLCSAARGFAAIAREMLAPESG